MFMKTTARLTGAKIHTEKKRAMAFGKPGGGIQAGAGPSDNHANDCSAKRVTRMDMGYLR
jgi:hypothetical protein